MTKIHLRITAAILLVAVFAEAKPIMVTFGTSQGPITPPEKPEPPIAPRNFPANPAPVFEETDDVPNPSTYRPMLPHQYRTKLFSVKPPASLVFGTPIDQRFTPVLNGKNDFQEPQKEARNLGIEYTGPHVFDRQEYEIFEAKKLKTTLQPSVQYIKPHYFQQKAGFNNNYYNSGKIVPQIGIVYSSGVRYYIPQVVYYNQDQQDAGEEENSVYDQQDVKNNYKV